MSNWYDPDHLSDGTVRDNVGHQENDDWDCEIELSCHKKDVTEISVNCAEETSYTKFRI